MHESVQFEADHVQANLDERTVSVRLIPFNEEGRTNVGRFMVEAGAVAIPEDPSVVSINIDHVRHTNVGRAVALDERTDGVYATFSIARGAKGDAALADALDPNGKRRKVSGEFGPVQIKDGKLTPGTAELWGAAFVEAGAFPSAMVLAADTPEAPPAEVPPPTEESTEHLGIQVENLPEDITAVTPSGDSAVYEPAPAPVQEPNPEGESNVTATAPAGATAPAPEPQVLAGLPGAPAAPASAIVTARPVDIEQVYAAFAALKADPHDSDKAHALAALTDITVSGSNPLLGSGVVQPDWLGQLFQGMEYEREYITLGTLGTRISIGGKLGFKVKRGTVGAPLAGPDDIPNGGTWAGNKSEINSYNGFTQTAASFRRNFAVGADIGREFYDLPGGAEYVEAFLRLFVEDYMYWSDTFANYDWITAAGNPVAAATADYPADYPPVMGMLIQGILAVKAKKDDKRRDKPTFAIANAKAYAALVYAAGGAENLPEFVKIAISTNSEGSVDGEVQVVEGDTGIDATASVIVGAKRAIEFDEVPGGPLKIDAIELARGGIDKAVHGYLQTFMPRTEAVVHIGTPDAFAQSTVVDLGSIVKYTTTPYRVVVAGTTAAGNPTPPAVGSTVVSGSATLLRLA